MSELFSIFEVAQQKSYCGPCSMSYCFFILGKIASQQDIAAATGLSWWVRKKYGCDEKSLSRAARAFGAVSRFLKFEKKKDGQNFAEALKKQLLSGYPAILNTDNFSHWVAVLGYLEKKKKFVINDPNDKKNIFVLYGKNALLKRCWNIDKKEKEGNEYFAILLKNKRSVPPLIYMTEDFLKLCAKGSAQNANSIITDLFEISERSLLTYSGSKRLVKLAAVLKKYEDAITENAHYWSKSKDMDKNRVRELYRDFTVAADAVDIRIPKNFDLSSIVSQMTALLCAAIWNKGRLS